MLNLGSNTKDDDQPDIETALKSASSSSVCQCAAHIAFNATGDIIDEAGPKYMMEGHQAAYCQSCFYIVHAAPELFDSHHKLIAAEQVDTHVKAKFFYELLKQYTPTTVRVRNRVVDRIVTSVDRIVLYDSSSVLSKIGQWKVCVTTIPYKATGSSYKPAPREYELKHMMNCHYMLWSFLVK